MGRSPRESVLLIQGCDNPDGWRQVRRLRENAGVHVQTPELPSHQSAPAGLSDDAVEVRDAILLEQRQGRESDLGRKECAVRDSNPEPADSRSQGPTTA